MSKYFIGQILIHVPTGNKSTVIQLSDSGVLLQQNYIHHYTGPIVTAPLFNYEESLKQLRMYYIEYNTLIDIENNEI